MNPPRKIRVGHATYTVEMSRDMEHIGDTDGATVVNQRRLLITATLSPPAKQECLWHECIHAVIDSIGGTTALGLEDEKDEERLVSLLTGPLLSLLQENPTLVNYVAEKV